MLRWVLFLVPMALVSGALNLHVYRWVARTYHLRQRARQAVLVLGFGSLLGTIVGRFLDMWLSLGIGPLVLASAVVQLVVILTAVFLLPFDLLRLGRAAWARFGRRALAREGTAREDAAHEGAARNTAARKQPSKEGTQDEPPAAPAMPRRTFLEQAGLTGSLLVASSSSLYGTLKGRHDYRIEDVPLRLPGLHPAFDGFTIVQLSDVHVGTHVGQPELAAAWDLVRQAKPDLIVLTGDLLDSDPRCADELGQFVRRLGELSPRGVVAISGNHDFYAGIDPTCHALEKAGATVLRNRGVVVGDAPLGSGKRTAAPAFALLGVDDVMGPRFGGMGPDLPAALAGLPQSQELPRILLCHNPQYFAEAAGQVALQLSGHTHGGQIRLGVSPADLFLPHGWVRGKYEHRGSTLYVNRGFGTVGPPTRIGAPPEVTRLILEA